MDKLEILKYICAYDLDYGTSDSELYRAQSHYYASVSPNEINFDPLLWLCNNAKVFFDKCKVVYTNNNDKTPCSVFYNDKCLFHDGIMKTKSLTLICEFCIENKLKNKLQNNDFNLHDYYAIHYEIIDKFDTLYNTHKYFAKCISDPVKLFYILYGYWNNVSLHPLDGNIITASLPKLISMYGIYANNSLQTYFMNNELHKLSFCPYTYAASNYEKLEFMLSTCKFCPIEDGDRFTKHYIRSGYNDKLSTNSFNKWNYLANNYKRIRKLMVKNSQGKEIWDIYRLTSAAVAMDFLKRRHKSKKNVFNEVEFVKSYIDHEFVNKDKKLCIENAAEYFVTYYVLNKDVRYNTTLLSKIIDFAQGRAVDTMKQIPLNASRFLIETRCL